MFVLTYNPGNFLRRLVLPGNIKHWSLRTLLMKLIKIGAKVLRHSRYVIFQMAEVAVSKLIAILSLFAVFFLSVSTNADSIVKKAHFIQSSVIIDGVLNDAAWKNEPFSTADFYTYNPTTGMIIPQKTKIWLAYDEENIYFAFYCLDDDPAKIKTTITKRDSMFSDDWIAVGIDFLGNRETLRTFYINPNGIQGDSIESASNIADPAADWVWYSAGRVVDDGYIVEMKLPVESFQFNTSDNFRMNIIFYRKISRTGMEGTNPNVPPGTGAMNNAIPVEFPQLKFRQTFELLPSITSSSLWDRKSPEEWSSANTINELSLSFDYGITSTVNLSATYNPDFSQVESDSFTVLVNQRYPIFYSEKRPFFMETNNTFNLAGTDSYNNVNMRTTFHSRKIVDPLWGAKLNGKIGNFSFAFLSSGDEAPGREFDDGVNPNLGMVSLNLQGRVKFNLSGLDYVGALYSSSEIGDKYNRSIGADFLFKAWDNHTFTGNFLSTESSDPATGSEKSGHAFSLVHQYISKSTISKFYIEDYAKDFQLDTAFYNRTGITAIKWWFALNWFPDPEVMPWLSKWRLYFLGAYIHDKFTDMNDYFASFALVLFTTKQGWFRLDYTFEGEAWQDVMYHIEWWNIQGRMQLTNWLYFYSSLKLGNKIMYEAESSYLGDNLSFVTELMLTPTENLNQSFLYIYERFTNLETDTKEYDVNIFQSKTTYNLNKNFLLRALIQYDSYSDRVVTDLLASFTLIPGTVIHLGYGSLYREMGWQNNEWKYDSPLSRKYKQSQSLFFKVSYLVRF